MKNERQKIKVVELFAGVGGFRVGLEKSSKMFETIWANQWEPSSKIQHAFDVYSKHFAKTSSVNVNENISVIWDKVPEHDFLVGGFPCQDYSVAHGNKAKGIHGKKGVLWWDIHKIIEKRLPRMILLENVDRLLNSPSSMRGRDFAIMLRSLNDLGYIVEWKAITASDYGMPQKRRRVFIFASKYPILGAVNEKTLKNFILNSSILNSAFKNLEINDCRFTDISEKLYKDLASITDKYNQGKFNSTGVSCRGKVFSANYKPVQNLKAISLRDIMDNDEENYIYLNDEQLNRAMWCKESKKITRRAKNGFEYKYTEGKMSFPDDSNKPGRTMLTSEGTINRSSHFIQYGNRFRFLTPLEAERMNGFPDNWTIGKTNRQRCFFMGNALVVGIVEKIGKEIVKKEKEKTSKISL